jgi:hypothetical protein
MTNSGLIYEGFLRSSHEFPHRPALEVANRVVTYSDLQQRAFQLAATLQKYDQSNQPPLTAIGNRVHLYPGRSFARPWICPTESNLPAGKNQIYAGPLWLPCARGGRTLRRAAAQSTGGPFKPTANPDARRT